MNTLAAEP